MYNAILTKIQNIRPHNNADRLDVSSIYWNQVIVSKWTQIWQLWVFFPVDGRLWQNFCTQNDLIRRKDESWNTVWGMFEDNRKIKCQKFRWEKSEGFRVPISHFDYLNYDFSQHDEWYMFNTIWTEKICDKLISAFRFSRCVWYKFITNFFCSYCIKHISFIVLTKIII